MTVRGPIWERYEQAAQGISVTDDADFEQLLEEPDEFELRVLVRHFDKRQELLERIGRFEHDPPGEYTEEEVDQLVQRCVAAFGELATAYAPGEFAWASSAEPLEIVRAPEDDQQVPRWCDSRTLHEKISNAVIFGAGATTISLMHVLSGRTQSVGLFYLLGPLLEHDFDFESILLLGKAGRYMWIDDGTVFLRTRLVPRRWVDGAGWNPLLDWPTDADIGDHQRDFEQLGERTAPAMDPQTPPAVLAELARDQHPAVRVRVAGNPSTPSEVVEALAADSSRYVIIALLDRDSIPTTVLVRALDHKHPRVRAALAKRNDLDDTTKTRLAQDPYPEVIAALEEQPPRVGVVDA